jgi:predicted acetyltransferase
VTLTYRVPTDDDFDALLRRDEEAFGDVFDDAARLAARDAVDLDRFRMVLDGRDVVGLAGSFEMELTLPGLAVVPLGGTTWVSVAPTHRRQGILRRLLDDVHRDIADRGAPIAGLISSEGGIYERFGYGIATRSRVTTIDRRLVSIAPDFVPAPGSVRLVDPMELVDELVEIHTRYRRARAGEVDRSVAVMKRRLHRLGAGVRCALHADGYALWKIVSNWGNAEPQHRLDLGELTACTADAHVALWHVVLSHDLVGPIRSEQAIGLDDPLPYLLTDQRAVRTDAVHDMLWLRPDDVGRLFSERSYRVDDTFVIEVNDTGERWRVTADAAAPTDTTADLVSTRAGLGSLLLGGTSVTELARGRRVEIDPALLGRADAFFGWSPTPRCTTMF